MTEYIKRSDVLKLETYGVEVDEHFESCVAIYDIENLPAADVVPRSAYEQVVWERDTAIRQLREDYGVGLGQKKSKEKTMKYCFGDIVIVDENQIGVIVKSWCGFIQGNGPNHDVYVRSYNGIKNYPESEIHRYMVRHKYLDEQEMEWQENAEKGL